MGVHVYLCMCVCMCVCVCVSRDISIRVDPTTVTYHKPDPLAEDGWVTLSQRLVQTYNNVAINGTSTLQTNLSAVPGASATSGAGTVDSGQ